MTHSRPLSCALDTLIQRPFDPSTSDDHATSCLWTSFSGHYGCQTSGFVADSPVYTHVAANRNVSPCGTTASKPATPDRRWAIESLTGAWPCGLALPYPTTVDTALDHLAWLDSGDLETKRGALEAVLVTHAIPVAYALVDDALSACARRFDPSETRAA